MSASSPQERLEWFNRGVAEGHDFMVWATDTFPFPHEDYPIFTSAENVLAEVAKHNGSDMQIVKGVFDLKKPSNRVLEGGHTRDDLALARSRRPGSLEDGD